MPTHAKTALPQDPSAPSGRSTVISMVRNKNNLEDLRLRRIIEDYDKELVFKVKTHDFEKLDTYEFLRNLKACDSDKLSQFKEIQQSIREMPTPDTIELNHLSQTFHSLDLHILGENKALNSVPSKGKRENSSTVKSRHSFDSRSRFPQIQRAQTEPLMSFLRKKSKAGHTVKGAVTQAWQPVEEEVNMDITRNQCESPVKNRKKSVIKKKLNKEKTDKQVKTSCSSDDCDNGKSNVQVKQESPNNEESVPIDSGEKATSAKSLLKYPLVNENASKIEERQNTELTADEINNRNLSNKTLTVSYSVLNDSESSVRDSVASLKEYVNSGPRTRTSKSTKRLLSRSEDLDDVFDREGTSRSSLLLVSQISMAKSSVSSQQRLKLLSRYDKKPPQKISLPTLLSMGIGTLKSPEEFLYRGITYAPWSHQSQRYKDSMKDIEVTSQHRQNHYKENNNKVTKEDNKEVMKDILMSKSRKLQKSVPFEVRMQNLFTEVDKLIEKPEKNVNQFLCLQNLAKSSVL